MKMRDLRKMKKDEWQRILKEKRVQAVKLRFDIASKQLKNNREYRKVKRDIARLLTLINMSEK